MKLSWFLARKIQYRTGTAIYYTSNIPVSTDHGHLKRNARFWRILENGLVHPDIEHVQTLETSTIPF
jgi:hypothetical protein